MLIRQVWPSAGCARRLVPHDPLPHEIVERVLLSPDLSGLIFSQLCSAVDPGVAVAFSSASSELWALTHAQRQQLRNDYNAAAELFFKLGTKSWKELREARSVDVLSYSPETTVDKLSRTGLSEEDLATFGTLGSLLPALDQLGLAVYPVRLNEPAAGHDGVQRLAQNLGAGALPAVTIVSLRGMHVGDEGASALAAALDRGALPRLEHLCLSYAAIGDAGVVALAPALQRLPALRSLDLTGNRLLGDVGAAALVAPPPPPAAGAPPTTIGALTRWIFGSSQRTGVLPELSTVLLNDTRITDSGCAALIAAIRSGALPALHYLYFWTTPASAASKKAVLEALVNR